MKLFYMINIGYHLGQTIRHLVLDRTNDYLEMLLHHLVTLYLLFGSYMINLWECGAIIAYLHNVSDILGHLTKCLGQTTYDKITIPAFICMMGVWFWTRNIMLAYCTYNVWV